MPSSDHATKAAATLPATRSGYSSALTLMRIPFSAYLMPIYWFALSTVTGYDLWRAVAVFLVLHVLVYPASNGYNSYCDRDEGSIGGLERPPKVTRELFYLVILFDVLAVALAVWLSPLFGALVAAYLLVSKAYSNDSVRLKKYPLLSTAVVTVFQGAFTYAMVQVGLGFSVEEVLQTPNSWYAVVSTLFLCGSYPLTQVYQHEEDAHRGDKTLSLLLGIKGTFLFAAVSLLTGTTLLLSLYLLAGQIQNIVIFLLCTGPIVYFFLSWVLRVYKNRSEANYKNTMQMNKISSLCISLAFISIIVVHTFF
ncbi:prenyltransferase [Pontibacter qinzhouensis]|uniref:Prenyltransferase n=1 Tax=Pontibacter qinzhouensis TaxID=2603253 RepID=A0A5C8JFZ1_9BACT|nr:UbiA family prenyltransferase [Pontibacter qinzhouensis]TXK37415.1 prenyltransferase [Pontibacter qinzhouensis]